MKETLKQIIEQTGDNALSQHIPLTSDVLADGIIKSGIIPCEEKPFDSYVVVHKCSTPAGLCSEIKNRFDALKDALGFALMLKSFPDYFLQVELYGMKEDNFPLINWQCGTQPQREDV